MANPDYEQLRMSTSLIAWVALVVLILTGSWKAFSVMAVADLGWCVVFICQVFDPCRQHGSAALRRRDAVADGR